MNRESLLRYAEAGVRTRLKEIQDEINLMADEFPELVKNHDGTIPAVLPLEYKGKSKGLVHIVAGTNGKTTRNHTRGRKNGSAHDGTVTLAAIKNYLEHSPEHESTTKELAKVAGITSSGVLYIIRHNPKLFKARKVGTGKVWALA